MEDVTLLAIEPNETGYVVSTPGLGHIGAVYFGEDEYGAYWTVYDSANGGDVCGYFRDVDAAAAHAVKVHQATDFLSAARTDVRLRRVR